MKLDVLSRLSDEHILKMLRQKGTEEKGIALLVEKYGNLLYAQIRRMVITHQDTDDVLQEVLLKVWKNINGFEGRSALSTWLYRIAANEAIGFLNRQKRQPWRPEDLEARKNIPADQDDSQTFDSDVVEQMLNEALSHLPERQRQVFELRYFEAMPYSEMSRLLSVSEGGLKASFHHAVKKLEAFIKAKFPK